VFLTGGPQEGAATAETPARAVAAAMHTATAMAGIPERLATAVRAVLADTVGRHRKFKLELVSTSI
jgi:hypothetical protein